MPALSATAPAKVILFGEHAAVYNRPAIAIPVRELSAKVIIRPEPGWASGEVRIKSPATGLDALLDELPEGDPIAASVWGALEYLGIASMPACTIRITSTIPVAAGLGSGAAVSVALARGVSAFLGSPLTDDIVSKLAFEVEKIYHGTPSGIDNSVVALNKPIYFIKGKPAETLRIGSPLRFIIADSGHPSPTLETVSEVRRRWQAEPGRYNTLFDKVAEVVEKARQAMERGEGELLGLLLDKNQEFLEQLGVSTVELNRLIESARQAGGLGAKLSGGGGGGNIITLVDASTHDSVFTAVEQAGATRVISTIVR